MLALSRLVLHANFISYRIVSSTLYVNLDGFSSASVVFLKPLIKINKMSACING